MNKNQDYYDYYGLIISVILLFGVILFYDKDLKESAIESLFIVGMMIFNYGIAIIYRTLKRIIGITLWQKMNIIICLST